MSQTRLFLRLRKPEAFHLASLLDPHFEEEGIATVLFEDEEDPGFWVWSAYVEQQDTERGRAMIVDRLGGDAFGLIIGEEQTGNVDWVTETLRGLAPVQAGSFLVHGSHDREAAKKARYSIEIDAGQAFGTGHHGTTAGCLDILELVVRQRRPTKIMDIGTGSAVLAMGAFMATRSPVLASDIDPIAIEVARRNLSINGCANGVKAIVATGFQHRSFSEFGKADLMMANILARPLEQLAFPMRQHLAPGADVILSGLLPYQKARIVSAYRRQGLVFRRAIIRDGWLSLLLSRP